MDRFVNVAVLRNPLNWLTVVVMCLFALMLLQLVSPEQAPGG